MREGEFKLILDRETGTRELYHLADDPGERVDVAARHPELAQRLAGAISELDASAIGASPPVELSPELVERLRELGYLGGEAPAPD